MMERRIFLLGLMVPIAAVAQPPAVPPAFTMTVSGDTGTFSWRPGEPLIATVSVGPVDATGLIADAVMTDASTGRRFGGGGLKICDQPDPPKCDIVHTIPRNSTRNVYLRPLADDDQTPGEYVGTVELRANEGRSGANPLTLHVTGAFYRVFGVLAVALGVFLSYFWAIGIRNKLARDQLLAPASEVQDRLKRLKAVLAASARPDLDSANIAGWIDAWIVELQPRILERRHQLPSIWAFTPPSAANAQVYQQSLDQASAWARALDHIVKLGFCDLAKLVDTAPPGAPSPSMVAAWKAVDHLAPEPVDLELVAPDLSALDMSIANVVASAQGVLAKVKGYVGPLQPPAMPTASERIHFQINVLSLANWATAAVLTIAVGSYVLVLSRLDFGHTNDFLLCATWGFGLPSFTQLAQATPASLAGTVGVTLPKPAA